MKDYDHKKIEKKWQGVWDKSKIYQAKEKDKRKKFYGLIEFPYPSGAGLHVGHIRSNTAMDIISRKRRMEGYNVLYPIGWDAFGLPTENYAIKTGIQPEKVTKTNTDIFRKQLKQVGFGFDWSREINTSDPSYFKWTQWIFLQMFKKGLAYKKKTEINWCTKCKIGLANEEVVNGVCERCGGSVVKKEKEQWMLAITKYADRLDKDLDDVDYLEKIKIGQRNWIGRSEGSEIEFKIKEISKKNNIVILHGRNGSSKNYFYPWLKKELEKTGAKVFLPDLPNTNEPDDKEQADYIIKNIPLDENTVIITHSFGGIVAMRILERGIKVKGLIQFSTPLSGRFLDGKIRKSVTDSVKKGFDFKKIKKQADYFKVIFDSGDNVVPKEDQENLAKQLEVIPYAIKAKEIHFCADEELEMIDAIFSKIKVFTTRADTIFGATYVVLAPEHELVEKLKIQISNKKEVEDYIKEVKNKPDIERTAENKEKTGIELKGIKAINPANNEEIPIWIADYVLVQYGTGAVMAVPAHDERDFEFAQKYDLEIKKTIAPYFTADSNHKDVVRSDKKTVERKTSYVLVFDKKNDRFLCLDWEKNNWHSGIIGGVDEGETYQEAALREIKEETGYLNLKFIKDLGGEQHNHFFAAHKDENRYAIGQGMLFELINEEKVETEDEHTSNHKVIWIKSNEMSNWLNLVSFEYMWKIYICGYDCFIDDGILYDSGKFNGMSSEEARREITKFVGGKIVTKYKLRDWVFSRQRYWGEPIPIINCSKCGYVPVSEKNLPVLLPKVKSYEPTDNGESPLATISKWVNTTCPKCKGKAKRETDTMPNWAGSSWYYLRYTDPTNKKEFASMKRMKYWTPVDWYNGGMEHVTLHLLYSRFWHKFLYDLKLVPTKEPYQKRTAHGMISAEGGEKMSKSKGNTIDPKDIVATYGADTLRIYEMFIGPFDQTVVWNTNSIIGSRRFLERVWRMREKIYSQKPEIISNQSFSTLLNKTIKKITEDIESMSFNTAISSMMILVNEMEKTEVNKDDFKMFLQILAPFAPHISEELWSYLGERKSIHLSPWPKWDKEKIVDEMIKIAVQVNGKVRIEILISKDMTEESIKDMALKDKNIITWIEGKEVKRVIYVPLRIINIVV